MFDDELFCFFCGIELDEDNSVMVVDDRGDCYCDNNCEQEQIEADCESQEAANSDDGWREYCMAVD